MPSFSSVDEYIAAQPVETQARLRELRAIIRQIVPDATEVITYDMPTYKLGGRRVAVAQPKPLLVSTPLGGTQQRRKLAARRPGRPVSRLSGSWKRFSPAAAAAPV